MAAPGHHSMGDMLGDRGYLMIRKTTMCCRCWTPQMHWHISEYADEVASGAFPPAKMTALEYSPCLCRACCHLGARESTYKVYAGEHTHTSAEGQPALLSVEKSCTCHRTQCCMLPYYTVRDAAGTDLGTARFVCCPCVPTINLEVPTGQPKYKLAPETCCCCFIRPRCDGKGAKCCRVQYLVRDLSSGEPISDAKISELWAGAMNTIMNRTQYQCKYPPSADDATKATMLAANLLLDLAVYEADDQQQNN